MIDLRLGDCFEVMQSMADNSVDLVLTDPPYGLSFMGKKWDYDVPPTHVWYECLRVLKPGGHLMAFAGTRTQHRMACRIEDAGFEIRDMLAWVYGSGFPKSHNGPWGGTALKPALEPITMARKPLVGTVAANVLEYGTGGLNIDACRVGTDDGNDRSRPPRTPNQILGGGKGTNLTASQHNASGRWPANLIHDGSEEVVGMFPHTKSGKAVVGTGRDGNHTRGIYGAKGSKIASCYAYEGSAARFFYVAKSSRRERGEGNHHPTVKPIALMEYLVKLASSEGQVVIDPFMGSGTTGIACQNLNRKFIGIEMDQAYFEIAKSRINNAASEVLF